MAPTEEAGETVLIVDDEESVRRTFREWLEGAGLDCRILTAADAEAALVQANLHTADLAILDWNLGAGNDGLRLLEDLYLFNPDIIAIMITGFAHQATPLDAMRMGVRDYLDKNQDLDRGTFLAAVRKQLDRIRPAKRERRLHRSLVSFREAVEKIMPLVQAAATLNDPVPLPEAVHKLLSFLLRTTGARQGVLLVHSYDPERRPAEICRVYDAAGKPLAVDLVPFARSVAGTVVSLQEPYVMNRLDEWHASAAAGNALRSAEVAGGQPAATGSLELQPFERGRQSLLAAPMAVSPGTQVVLELFDKQTSASEEAAAFTAEDKRLVAAAADFGAEMLRQAMAEQRMHQVLFAAVDAALGASDQVAESLRRTPGEHRDEPLPAVVLDQLRQGFRAHTAAVMDPEETLRLAEAIRVLAVQHGAAAVRHCTQLVENLRELLDQVTGAGEARS